MHEVLVNRLGGLSLPRKSVVRLTDRPDMTLDVYRGRKTTIQQYNSAIQSFLYITDHTNDPYSKCGLKSDLYKFKKTSLSLSESCFF